MNEKKSEIRLTFKIIIAGDGGVGKTTLLHRYIDGTFLKDTKMTIGVEIHNKALRMENYNISLQIWDFGGQERFRFLQDGFIAGANAAILMFDLTRTKTLFNLKNWVELIEGIEPNTPMILVGGKSDLDERINGNEENVSELIEKFNLINYFKVSSKSGHNVNQVFNLLIEKLIEGIKQFPY